MTYKCNVVSSFDLLFFTHMCFKSYTSKFMELWWRFEWCNQIFDDSLWFFFLTFLSNSVFHLLLKFLSGIDIILMDLITDSLKFGRISRIFNVKFLQSQQHRLSLNPTFAGNPGVGTTKNWWKCFVFFCSWQETEKTRNKQVKWTIKIKITKQFTGKHLKKTQ